MPRWSSIRWGRRDGDRKSHAGIHLDRLGPNWHIRDWPNDEPPGGLKAPGLLIIGPGGVYAVTVIDHGRARILIAGDIVQFNGKRPAYVAEARRKARRAQQALAAAVGQEVPVTPIMTFIGSGMLGVHGLPKRVLVATAQDLERLLIGGGARITPATASRLATVAADPATWANTPYRPEPFRWQ